MKNQVSDKEKLIAIHQRANKNLVEYFYCFQADPNDYKKPAPFHFRISDILLNDDRNFAVEMFRETGKTSLVLKSFPLYCLTYPKEDRSYIVIIKNNQESASAKLKEISNEYINNDVLNQNLIRVNQESAKVLEVVVRGADKKNHTIRIEAYGKGSAVRGVSWGVKRPHVTICDDLQDIADSESDTVQEKDWNWFLSDVMFLAKTGRVFIIGNNLGAKCIIERIFANDVLNFQKLKVPALDDDDNPTWSEAFSKEFLMNEKQQYISLGKVDIWYRERMCIALAEELKIFKKEYFRYYDENDLKNKQIDYYIIGDPASSKSRKADDAVWGVIGKERNRPDWYIIEFVGGTAIELDPVKYVDALFFLYDKYRPLKVGIETVGYQEALRYFIQEEQKKREKYFSIYSIKTRREKEQKIKGVLQPMYKTGVIHHRKNMFKLEEQLLAFPKGLHDDYPDVLAMCSELMSSTEYDDEDNITADVEVFGGQVVGFKENDYTFSNY